MCRLILRSSPTPSRRINQEIEESKDLVGTCHAHQGVTLIGRIQMVPDSGEESTWYQPKTALILGSGNCWKDECHVDSVELHDAGDVKTDRESPLGHAVIAVVSQFEMP